MSKHKVIRLATQQLVHDTICAQRGCKFKGKSAQIGVCFSSKGALADFDKLAKHEEDLLAELKQLRKREDAKGYVRSLEAHYVSAMMNWQLSLDECIRLRRDIALAKERK